MCSPDYAINRGRHRWSVAAALLLVIALPLLAACGTTAQGNATIKVVATLAPLADWARHVGGDRVHVTQIVPTGVDPKRYTLTDTDRQALAEMDVLVYNGLGLEPWLQQAVQTAAPSDLAALELAQYIGSTTRQRITVRVPDRGEDGESNGSRDVIVQPATAPSPYVWLSPGPDYAQRAVLLIGDTLSRVDPDHLLDYRRNAERYNGDLENLGQRIKRQIARWPRLKLPSGDRLAMQSPDPAWHYFARYYGIDLRTPSKLASITPVLPPATPLFVSRFSDTDVPATDFSERQPDGVLNPLSDDDYFTLLQRNVNMIQRGMRRLAQVPVDRPRSLLAIP